MATQGREIVPERPTPRRSVRAAGMLFLIGASLVLGAMPGWAEEIAPPVPPPDIQVTPGDGFVRIFWEKQADSLLTDSGIVDSSLSSWTGASVPFVTGTLEKTCDQNYRFEVLRSPLRQGILRVSWNESPRGSLSLSGQEDITFADSAFAFSGGLSFGISPSIQLAVTPADSVETFFGAGPDTGTAYGGWNPGGSAGWSMPIANGLFLRDQRGLFVFTAENTGEIFADSTDPGSLSLAWSFAASDTDTVVAQGSLVIPRADTLVWATVDSIVPGPDTVAVPYLRVGLSAGSVSMGDSFVVWVEPSARGGDVVMGTGKTFEAYIIWKSEVIDLDRPQLREKVWRCGADPDSMALFEGDTREYFDYEVQNGYPYYYVVTVSDLPRDSTDVISDSLWFARRQKVYPRRVDWDSTYTQGRSQFDTADRVMVVPNPYKVSEEWEEGVSKIQFVNLPPGAKVWVYTGSGEFVVSIRQWDPASDRISWNLRNWAGQDVTSGIYIYKVESPHGEKVGRFIVIR